MFQFQEKLIYTGKKELISKKTGSPYTIYNFLDDSGEVFGAMAENFIEGDFMQLDLVLAHFIVVPGRYTQIKLLSMEIAK